MKNHIKILGIIGIVLVSVISFIAEKSSKTEKKKIYSNKIAMMLETGLGTGTYEMTTRDSWPTDQYTFNLTLSKCKNGGEVSWDDTNKKVLMSGNTADKCYVYFDKFNEFYYSGIKYSAPYGYKISD